MERHVCSCESVLGYSGAFPGHTQAPLSLVLQMWAWEQVCSLAMLEKKSTRNHKDCLTAAVHLLGKPSGKKGVALLREKSHQLTNNMTLGESVHFILGRSLMRTGTRGTCFIGLRIQGATTCLLVCSRAA